MRTQSFDVLPLSYILYGFQSQVQLPHRRAMPRVILDVHAHLSGEFERKRFTSHDFKLSNRKWITAVIRQVYLSQCTYIVVEERELDCIGLPTHLIIF